MTSSVITTLLLLVSLATPALSQVWQFRLAGNGATNRKGRLEIKIGNGPWGTVCKDGFDNNDAVVACRSLGIEGGVTFLTNAVPVYGNPGNALPISRFGFACKGNEQTLAGCISAQANPGDCVHTEDIAVECLGVIEVPETTIKPDFNTLPPVTCTNNNQFIRLVGGTGPTEGRVEIAYQGEWGTICDDFWDKNDATVVCRMLCDSTANAQAVLRSQFESAPATTKIHLNRVRCVGTETQLDQCPHGGWANTTSCTHKKDAGVICAPPGTLPVNPLKPTITCPGNAIVATFNKSEYPNLQISEVEVFNPGTNCNADKTEDTNAITVRVPFNTCNMVKGYNATHIIYKVPLQRTIPSTNTIITRISMYKVEISCEYPRNKEDNSKLDPIMIEAPPQTGSGEFTVQLKVVDPATGATQPLPAKVPLGDIVGIAVELTAVDPQLKIVVPDCYASPDLVVSATSKVYQLVQDKCRQDDSLTILRIDEKTIVFTFKIFMFMDGTQPDADLYIHCAAIVCGINEEGEKCDQTCDARRKRSVGRYWTGAERIVSGTAVLQRSKRSVSSLGLTLYEVEQGPFRVEVPDDIKTTVLDGILRREEAETSQTDEENQIAKPNVNEGKQKFPSGAHKGTSTAAMHHSAGTLLPHLLTLFMVVLITVFY